jgi:hypothetical protein
MRIRKITFPVAAALAVLSSATFAQQTTGTAPAATAPPSPAMPPTVGRAPDVGGPLMVGGPLISGSETGLNKIADDGVSTKTVGAVPCSKAARETDGTTTCVGIPDGSLKSKRR